LAGPPLRRKGGPATNYPQYLLNNISYNAFGEVVSATYGDGIVRTNTYDKMGRPTEIQDGTTSSPTYRLYITYYGNGSVKTFNDTVSGSYTFTYDAFNRLVSSTNTAQSYSWTYDQFGNRWHQDKTAGTGYTVDLSFNNNNNRITTSGYSYDAAGNLLKDGSACNPCWQYDDNGNLVSSSYGSSAASYSYDALGRRVEKIAGGTTYDFVLDGSNPLDEYQGSVWPTAWSRTTGGVFTYANGTTYFNRTDDLGTPRVSTDYTGAVKRTETMGPFGDGFTESFAGLDFTGLAGGVWDQENNGDHFGAREYAKTQGRWLTPDPAGLAAVDPSNPQTWNRYAYVLNNPVSFTDPTGLQQCSDSASPAICQGGYGMAFLFGVTSGWNEFELLENPTPVTTQTYTPAQPISTPIDQINNQYGEAVSATLYIPGSWSITQIGSIYNLLANNDNWWGNFGRVFANGVIHGVRQPGQSFTQCVLQNANTTTGGAHGALLGAVAATSGAALMSPQTVGNVAVGGSTVVGQILNSLPISPDLAVKLGVGSGLLIYDGINLAASAAPHAIAAEGGLLIGSAINCR
jgi:RHS repeat-associated protein